MIIIKKYTNEKGIQCKYKISTLPENVEIENSKLRIIKGKSINVSYT